MATAESLSAQDQADLAHMLTLLEHGRTHAIDFADDAQYRFFLRQMRNSGASEKDDARFFQTLEAARADALAGNAASPAQVEAPGAQDDTDALYDVNQINSFGTAPSGNSASSAFSSIVGGTIYTTLNLELFDGHTGASLGNVGLPTVYGEGEFEALQLTGSAPSNKTMESVFTYAYQKSGSAPVFNTVRFTSVESPLGPPTVLAPVLNQSHQGNAQIKVGIGRDPGHTPSDCDYYYYEPNIEDPNVRLPLVGSQKFASNIVTPLFNGSTPQNLMFACVLSKEVGGGSTPPLPITNTNLQNNIVVSNSDPTVLVWNFPWNPCVAILPPYCTDPTQLDGSAQFGAAAWARDSTLMLSMTIAVKTATSGGSYVPVSVYSASQGPYGPQDNGIWVTQPIFYTWHCVAAGTRITLADGSTMNVEDIRGGEAVITDDKGTIFTVVDTFGVAKDGELFVLRTEAGHELWISDGHPVLTPNGHVRSELLRAGDVVLTDQGPSKLTAVDVQNYKGNVHSFSLGYTKEEEQRFTDDNTNYYANGVLVGDNRVARDLAKKHRRRLETKLAKIPQEWHEDAKRNHARQLAR